MTVAELIAKLQEMPQDARVVIDGYESGLKDVTDVRTTEIVLNENESFYCGPHEETIWTDRPCDEVAVYIPR